MLNKRASGNTLLTIGYTIVLTHPPFKVSEEGWGEFDMQITLTAKERGGDHHVLHDLNFQLEEYPHEETIVCAQVS